MRVIFPNQMQSVFDRSNCEAPQPMITVNPRPRNRMSSIKLRIEDISEYGKRGKVANI